MNSFEDLTVWQESHKFVLMVYQLAKQLPTDERFGLISQMQRAAVSVPANIAEGYKRRGIKDKLRFYNISEASLEEVKYYLILSRDLGYTDDVTEIKTQANKVGQLITGLIRSTERRL